MYDIVILAVGGIKSASFRSACEDYYMRLSPFARIRVEEVRGESFSTNAGKEKSKQKEGERILKVLKKYAERAEVILLEESGTQYDSREFVDFLKNDGRAYVFVVGGALGFSEEVQSKNFKTLSLSKMTFPHEIARMLLLEQIYRAMTIAKGKEYHY